MNIRNIIIATSIAALTTGSFAYAQTVAPVETPIEQILPGETDPQGADETKDRRERGDRNKGDRNKGDRDRDCDKGDDGSHAHDDDHESDTAPDAETTDAG